MKVLVSDTSVIIDLERGGLLEAAFALPVELAVPDLLYEQELREYGGEHLVGLGLRVEELNDTGVLRAQGYRAREPRLSVPDCFALALAQGHKWALLSGDKLLRELAAHERVQCHGVLWVVECLAEAVAASPQTLHAGLQAMAAHPRSRLPRREVRLLLERLARL